MKKSLLTLLIASAFFTVGCEDSKMTQALLEAEKNIVQLGNDLKVTKADLDKKVEELNALSAVNAENETLKAELEKAQKNVALQVEIVKIFDKSEVIKHAPKPKEEYQLEETGVAHFVAIPKTNLAWLNQLFINKVYDPEALKTTPNPTEQDLVAQSEKNYQGMLADAKGEPVLGIEESIRSDYLGQRNHIASFMMQAYSYGGGAHGMHHTAYINVDLNKKAEIRLDDLIGSKNQGKLKKVLWKNYSDERLDEKGKYNGFANPKEFRISDQFYFDRNGIVFVYPPYELGPYAEGDVEILAGWEEINELLNGDYQRTEKDGFFKE